MLNFDKVKVSVKPYKNRKTYGHGIGLNRHQSGLRPGFWNWARLDSIRSIFFKRWF